MHHDPNHVNRLLGDCSRQLHRSSFRAYDRRQCPGGLHLHRLFRLPRNLHLVPLPLVHPFLPLNILQLNSGIRHRPLNFLYSLLLTLSRNHRLLLHPTLFVDPDPGCLSCKTCTLLIRQLTILAPRHQALPVYSLLSIPLLLNLRSLSMCHLPHRLRRPKRTRYSRRLRPRAQKHQNLRRRTNPHLSFSVKLVHSITCAWKGVKLTLAAIRRLLHLQMTRTRLRPTKAVPRTVLRPLVPLVAKEAGVRLA